MPLGLVAKIRIQPESLMGNRWVHDTAHRLVCARIVLLAESKALAHPPRLP